MATCKTQVKTKKQTTAQILVDRAKTHGDFTTHARLSMDLKNRIRAHSTNHVSCNFDLLSQDKQEALDMIMHKVARILNGNPDTQDHWDDIAGYATLAANRCLKD